MHLKTGLAPLSDLYSDFRDFLEEQKRWLTTSLRARALLTLILDKRILVRLS